jgi:hypothetical protein
MKWIVVLAALLLAGCAEPKYMWSKSGSSTFAQDSDGCKEDVKARLKASPTVYFLKDGNHYQGSGEWAQRTYNECMRGLGYTPTREMTSPETATAKAQARAIPVPAAATPQSPATMNMAGRLRELNGLLDQGLISQSEYDQRRQSLLNSM